MKRSATPLPSGSRTKEGEASMPRHSISSLGGRLAAPEEIVAPPAFVPLTVDDGLRTAPSADIIEVAIGDILIRVGRDVGEEHLARIFRAARAAT